MSFFGFDTNLPRDRATGPGARGIFENPDPFAEVARARTHGLSQDDDDAIDFEDTYDGLGDQLDETDDAFNDDTFGGGEDTAPAPVGKDFDFFGQTAQVSDVISEEQVRYNLQYSNQAPGSAAQLAETQKPKKSGYERYQDPGFIPEITAKSSVWGMTATPAGALEAPAQAVPAPSRKVMSLEEVEAQMRNQTHRPAAELQAMFSQPPVTLPQPMDPHHLPPQQLLPTHNEAYPQMLPPELLQQQAQFLRDAQMSQMPQHHQPPVPPGVIPPHAGGPAMQMLQNQNRPQNLPPNQHPARQGKGQRGRPNVPAGPSGPMPVITHPQQLMQLTEEQRAAYLLEDAKRAKRNHKIYLLSKGNGLMTPQDKNFITRIQLQQLVAATGNVNEPDSESLLSEDFYYQVFSQIRGAPRQHPRQPLGHFAQTYLLQTGGRTGNSRRHLQNADNHMQRMQQQVQRAVEAAKLKPKNKQLIIEGSLGKISFSNAKTPKPMLNIKRPESSDGQKAAGPKKDLSASDRKSILRNIEGVYSTLMQMEDHARHMPAPPDESDAEAIERHIQWRQKIEGFNQRLWRELKVLEPIVPGSTTPHPFIAFLSYPKGKKAIPRIFRHIDQEQRVTILTMIIVNLDSLDVVQRAQLHPGETQPPLAVREEVELFQQAVMPSLLGYMNEAPVHVIIGLLGLVLSQTHVQTVAKTRVGLGILTMLLSRAELVKEAGGVNDRDWQQWTEHYNRLFDVLEPALGDIFPGPINAGDDMYVWQFLAAMGIGASPEQQQRLVIGVKDRVMETVAQSKALPADMASQRLGNVNLFMRAIGLDVELLG